MQNFTFHGPRAGIEICQNQLRITFAARTFRLYEKCTAERENRSSICDGPRVEHVSGQVSFFADLKLPDDADVRFDSATITVYNSACTTRMAWHHSEFNGWRFLLILPASEGSVASRHAGDFFASCE